jgi:hypothetical protein
VTRGLVIARCSRALERCSRVELCFVVTLSGAGWLKHPALARMLTHVGVDRSSSATSSVAGARFLRQGHF